MCPCAESGRPPSSVLCAPSCARSTPATSPGKRLESTAARWSASTSIRAMTIKFAERMSRLGTEGAFEVLAKARRLEADGRHVVHLEIGEPDFATPEHIIESAISALQNGYTHYTPASGIMETRQ